MCALLHSLKQVEVGMRFKQVRGISTLNGNPLKSVDQFICPCNNISSTETNVTISIEKAWNASDWLSIIWKYDLADKIK